VSEKALGHEMVRFEDAFDVVAVDANGNTHDHVLWSFGDFAIAAEEVGAFKGFEAEATQS
jgi:hypothetical protein